MATGGYPGPLHPHQTRRNGYEFFFYDKHHRHDDSDDAQWLPELNHDEEFAIFDLADWHDLADSKGNLYGIRRTPDGDILMLGTRNEQVAEFPWAHPGHAWHGYPLWPLKRAGPENRRKLPAPRDAIDKMVQEGLLTRVQGRRLKKGAHV